MTPSSPAVQAGLSDEESIRAAYVAHGPELYRFALRGCGDAGAAEDLVQEVFLRAWRASERFDPELSSLRVWLFAIARNAVIDHARASSARPWQQPVDTSSPEGVPSSGGQAPDPTEALMATWVVEEALHRLSPDHRVALVQTHLMGRPHAEVAAELGVPVGTVRSRIFYGLKALRVVMDELGVTP